MNYREGKALAENVNTAGVVRVRTTIKTGIRTVKLLALVVGGLFLLTMGANDAKEPSASPSPPATTTATPFRCQDSRTDRPIRCPLSDSQWVTVPPARSMSANQFHLCLSFSGPQVEWKRIGDTLKLRAKPGAEGQVAAYQWLPNAVA